MGSRFLQKVAPLYCSVACREPVELLGGKLIKRYLLHALLAGEHTLCHLSELLLNACGKLPYPSPMLFNEGFPLLLQQSQQLVVGHHSLLNHIGQGFTLRHGSYLGCLLWPPG